MQTVYQISVSCISNVKFGRKLHPTRNPVTGQHTSDTLRREGSKGKGRRHSEGLITERKWTPIATQRNRKPQNSASIQGKPTLTTCTGKITIINPVETSKGKFPKSANNKFVKGTVKETLASKGTSQRTEKACTEPEDLEEDTLGQDTEGNHTHRTIHFPIQQKPQTRGLEGYGSSSSAPPTPQSHVLEIIKNTNQFATHLAKSESERQKLKNEIIANVDQIHKNYEPHVPRHSTPLTEEKISVKGILTPFLGENVISAKDI
ncbi:hypothetical protein O181_095265 [Austropuccinia psidii MF-1]|uniref:Uncharacterized protein n=1 Tax=Austropuccinia psidii MF-1 TaxID=1389203 RepID=A0A9Q3J594_9BASI|nr:hypothetical protein [Austropuccinia psidii MF-1]